MGAPGGGHFCENGHLVYNAAHHEVYYEEHILKCDICDSTNIKFDYEWGDTDYPFRVPTSPIKTENGHSCSKCNLWHGEIRIYDVSLLFNKDKIEFKCSKCSEEFKYSSGDADDGFSYFCKKCHTVYTYNVGDKELVLEATENDLFDYNKVCGE